MSDYITQADLDWWLKLAPTLTFKNASTYEDTAPHNYVVRDRHLGSVDFDRACRVVHTFGELQNYYSRMNAYLVDPERNLKWWTMGMGTTIHGVINQADSRVSYGPQISPSTLTGTFTPSDGISSYYDEETFERVDESRLLRDVTRVAFGAYAPTLLDVGAGTGQVLDSGITTPQFTTVVDSSQGMLNHLALKHTKIDTIVPSKFSEAEVDKHEMVTAAGGSASYLSVQEIVKAHKLAKRVSVFSVFTEVPAWAADEVAETHEAAVEYLTRQAARLKAETRNMGLTKVFTFKKGY